MISPLLLISLAFFPSHPESSPVLSPNPFLFVLFLRFPFFPSPGSCITTPQKSRGSQLLRNIGVLYHSPVLS